LPSSFAGHFKKLFYVPEGNHIFGTTNNRSIVIWKYNSAASISTLKGHSDIIETLTYSMYNKFINKSIKKNIINNNKKYIYIYY